MTAAWPEPTVDTAAAQVDMASFYAAEYTRLARALSLYCGDRELGAELAQEAMVRAFRNWGRVSGLDHPEAWVHRVGINLATSAFRRAVVGRRLSVQPPTAAPMDERDGALALRAAVARLPRRQRAALVLRYFVDLPVEEVATVMGCASGTVKSLTALGIANLRRSGALSDVEEGSEAT